MFETLNSPDNVIGMRLTGLMTGTDIDAYRQHLDRTLARGERIGLCVDLGGLDDLEHQAMTKGMAADFELLRHLDQFARLALVSDKRWPHEIVGIFRAVLPDVPMKVFPIKDREQALAWAGDFPAEAPLRDGPAIRQLETDAEDVFAFEWNGTVGAEDLEPVLTRLRMVLDRHDKVRLLNRIRHYGFDPSILLQSGLVSVKLAAMEKVERYAIVGAPKWIERAVAFMDPLFPDMEVRTFPMEREEEAWKWIGAHERAHELAAH